MFYEYCDNKREFVAIQSVLGLVGYVFNCVFNLENVSMVGGGRGYRKEGGGLTSVMIWDE